MNMHARMSEKGQVVVSKVVRDRLGWQPGTDLDVVETEDGVTFRFRSARKKLTFDEAVAKLPGIYTHQGPPASLEDMDAAIEKAVAERHPRRGS